MTSPWATTTPVSASRATVLRSGSLSADLRAIATAAREAETGVVVAQGEVITQGEALAGLLLDPRVATGILAGGARAGRPFAMRTRSTRGRVVSAFVRARKPA
jgi:hypothetical protein